LRLAKAADEVRLPAIRKFAMSRIVAAVVGAMMLIASGSPAAAEPTVTELPLESGGSRRVLFISPANPRATLIMLPGGNGMVEFGPDATFRRMGHNFLLRTLPLWQEQGFAVAGQIKSADIEC
jgi:hypothetical protein